MIGRLLSFTAASMLVWLLIALPARAWWGDETVLTSAVALGVCLVPALGTLALVQWSWSRPIETQFSVALGGSGIRLLVVVVVTLLLGQGVPLLAANGLVAWVVLYYLLTLALEVGLLLWAWPDRPLVNPVNSTPPASSATATGAMSSPRVD